MSMIQVLPAVKRYLEGKRGTFIDGKWILGEGEMLPVFDPATGEVISRFSESTPQEVNKAVTSAHRSFISGVWANRTPIDRERILYKFADLLEINGEELAQLETLEQGKSIHISRMFEVGASVNWMRYAAGLTTKHNGTLNPVSMDFPPGAKFTAYTRPEPVGVVAGIVPWNFPLMIGMWKVMPALAAGCSVVIKPSENTPLTMMRMVELAIEAGIPPGVLNLVNGRGFSTGQTLTSHPLVSKISFTGSTATGKSIAGVAAGRLLPVTLELGGKNPAIVLADADVDEVVEGLAMAGFLNQGQVCGSCSRAYIAAPIFDRIVSELEARVKGMSIGPGMDVTANINPLASKNHQEKVLNYLNEPRIEVLKGGVVPSQGYYVSPSLVLNPDGRSRLTTEEVFGPVLNLTRVSGEEEALELANESELGLAASVWTSSLKKAMNLTPRVQAGTVWVNCHTVIDPNLPFGGFKQSGIGSDFGADWLDAYSKKKSVCIRH